MSLFPFSIHFSFTLRVLLRLADPSRAFDVGKFWRCEAG